MINYTDLENELAAKLNDYFTANTLANFLALPVPQNESEVKRGLDKARVWVAYSDSVYDPTVSFENIAQDEDISIRLMFVAQNLREADGMYPLIYHCKRCLLSYQPAGCYEKLWLGKFEDVEYQNLGIIKSLVMHTSTPNIGIMPAEATLGGNLTSVTSIIPPP